VLLASTLVFYKQTFVAFLSVLTGMHFNQRIGAEYVRCKDKTEKWIVIDSILALKNSSSLSSYEELKWKKR